MQLGEIAHYLQSALVGDRFLEIEGLCGISDNLPNRLSFAAKPVHLRAALNSQIPAFIVRPGDALAGRSCVLHDDPEAAIAQVGKLFVPSQLTYATPEAIHPSAIIHPSARLAPGVTVGAHAVLGADVEIGANSRLLPGVQVFDRVKIGADCVLYGNVVVREDCVLGDRVVLQPGVIIGGDGYGYLTRNGKHHKVPQLGNVVLEDDVEVGANTTIDRGRFTATRIGRGTKIDNLVMLAHNVQTGQDCLLVAQVGISGSTKLGDRVTLAGQVGVIGHLNICSDVTVQGKSVIAKHVLHPGVYAGIPIRPAKQWRQAMAKLYAAVKDDSPSDGD